MTAETVVRPEPWTSGYAQTASVNVLREACERVSGIASHKFSVEVGRSRVTINYGSWTYDGSVSYPLVRGAHGSAEGSAVAVNIITSATGTEATESGRRGSDRGEYMCEIVQEVWDTAARLCWSPADGAWTLREVPTYRVQHASDFDPATAALYGKTI